MEPDEKPEVLSKGNKYILMKDLYCYRILTADTKSQVFGTYSYQIAKNRFFELEHRQS